MLTEAVITCPHCGSSRRETLPDRTPELVWLCPGCGVRLTPRDGDDCVYCSYSNTVCPPTQEKRDGCSG